MGYLGTEHSKLTLVVLSNIGVSSLSREPHSGNDENKGTGILKRQGFGLEKFAISKVCKSLSRSEVLCACTGNGTLLKKASWSYCVSELCETRTGQGNCPLSAFLLHIKQHRYEQVIAMPWGYSRPKKLPSHRHFVLNSISVVLKRSGAQELYEPTEQYLHVGSWFLCYILFGWSIN